MPQGIELFELIQSSGALGEALGRQLLRQLLSTLSALHGMGLVHRDIKPENLLVSRLGGDGRMPRLKLIDFGFSTIEYERSDGLRGLAGSPEYSAPEVLSWLKAEVSPDKVHLLRRRDESEKGLSRTQRA